MENKGLLFIPDISGFSKFVNEMEIQHSRLIIQELLETIINSNNIGLELSEIEGDAILFYKFGESPDLKDIYKQVEKMFCEFHKSIFSYDHRRFCQCAACSSTADLTLKVITHYGEFTGLSVRNFNKLYGKDVIVAHRLMKNDIEQHEYWLVTKNVQSDPPPDFKNWMQWKSSSQLTESGEIPYYYTQLGELKNEIVSDIMPNLDLRDKVKVISLSREYETEIIPLFHASGDFNHRSKWQEGVKAVEEVNHFLPRIGMRCRCIMEDGQETIYSTSYSYSPEKIEFSESDEANNIVTYYALEKTGDKRSKLTIDYYVKKGFPQQIIFNLLRKKKTEDNFRKSLANLERLVKEIKVPKSG